MAKKQNSMIEEYKADGGILAVHGEIIEDVALAVKEAAGSGGMKMSDLTKISLPSGKSPAIWAVQTLKGEETREELVGAIIGDTEQRSYWEEAYDDNPGQPPNCTSQDMITGIGDPGGDCATCEFAQFGSAKKGKGQACQQRRILLLITPDSAMPMMVSIPPSSLTTIKKDLIRAAGSGIRPSMALWSFTLTKEKNDDNVPYCVANCEFVRRLTTEEQAICSEFGAAVTGIKVDASVISD